MRIFAVALLCCVLSCVFSISAFADKNEDSILQAGQWKYQLLVLNQGTTEQKAIGKLSFKDREVVGSPDHRLVTDLGSFMWSPYSCEATRCGWYKIDPMKK